MPDLTTALAVWGAILSTALGVLKFLEYRRDRPIVVVQISELHMHFDDAPVPDVRWLQANIVNVGRRATTVTGVSVVLPRRRGKVPCWGKQHFPVVLNENECYGVAWDWNRLTNEHGLKPSQFVVRADHGVGRRTWSHGPFARLWKLRRRG
jgi:hypothetical protein